MLRTVVLEADHPTNVQLQRGPIIGERRKETFYIAFALPESLHFNEPYSVRLSPFLPISTSKPPAYLAFCDFTQEQIVNGEYRCFLGLAIKGFQDNAFVPLATNRLPQYSQIVLETYYKSTPVQAATAVPRFIAILTLAPTRLVNLQTGLCRALGEKEEAPKPRHGAQS